jgi:MATE family multidrug resistance protein
LTEPTAAHPFIERPHRTLVALSLPVLISLIAEPVTGLVDTAFISRLGTAPLAALGIATALLSGVFWVFNFLGIGTQTEVARAAGTGRLALGTEAAGLAIGLGAAIGAALALASWPLLHTGAEFMTKDLAVHHDAVLYLKIRLLGGPAILVMMAAFGALRGLQEMRTPLLIAVSQNALNVVLDAILIFGWGPIPALGIAGAAWASVASQWLGAIWAVERVIRKLGLPNRFDLRSAGKLLAVGRDLFIRTGSLLVFIVVSTRFATLLGADAGAAHQVIRQFWMLNALLLDAFGAAAQSLIGFFLGASQIAHARRVARVACIWGLVAGVATLCAMLAAQDWVAEAFLPERARAIFAGAWFACALTQPINALAFVTDGIHWGTSDFRFLRNAMLASTAGGLIALVATEPDLEGVWIIMAAWITARTAFGIARIWPGIGRAPLRIEFDDPAQNLR